MKKLLLLSALLLISSFNFCPSPLTHHHFALLYLRYKALSDEERREFLVGTQLPDIRFLANLTREQTHPTVSGLAEVTGCSSPYIAGKLLHSYVDDHRLPVVDEQFGYDQWRVAQKYSVVVDGHINGPSKAEVPWNFDAFLKFVEEEILSRQYEASSVGALYKDIYNDVDSDTYSKEFGLSISQEITTQWHERVLFFLTHRPSEILFTKAETFKGLPPDLLRNWGPKVVPFSKDPAAQGYVDRFVAVFDSRFSEGLLKKK